MGVEQNVKSGGEYIGDYHVSLSDDEENDVQNASQASQTTSNLNTTIKMANKQNTSSIAKKNYKKKKNDKRHGDTIARN